MRKTKLTGTRYQPKAFYLTALSLLLISGVIGVCQEYKINILAELSSPFHKDPPIQWRTESEARLECLKSKKPLLYVFLVRGEDFSLRLENEALNTPQIYNYVNDNFIPVKYSGRPNSVSSKPDLPPNLRGYEAQFNWPNKGSLLVVPYKMRNANLNDITSSSNPVELGYQDMSKVNQYGYCYDECGTYYDRYNKPLVRCKPVLSDYRDNNDLLTFLYLGRIWHTLPPTKGLVHWQSPAVLGGPPGSKPRVVYMVQEYGASSDDLRLRQFFDVGLTSLLNTEYTPVLLEFKDADDFRDSRLQKYKARYGVSSLPVAVVVDSKSGKPESQRGYTDATVMTNFLRESVGKQRIRK